jgi:hypothetical protein
LFQPILMGKPRKVAETAAASAGRRSSGAPGSESDFASKRPGVIPAEQVD